MLSLLRFAPLVLLQLITLPTFSAAYSWVFNAPPQQCSNLSISITGSGVPPYRVLIIPFGATPLPNDTEVRHIVDHSFGNSTSTSFAINYPENSQFVAVVSSFFSSIHPSNFFVFAPMRQISIGKCRVSMYAAPSGHALFSEPFPPLPRLGLLIVIVSF
jgi:hypothetical protein